MNPTGLAARPRPTLRCVLQTPTGRIYMMALSPFPKDEDAIPS